MCYANTSMYVFLVSSEGDTVRHARSQIVVREAPIGLNIRRDRSHILILDITPDLAAQIK
jgi:hypothetical protein